eukprot:gene33122-40872_t
MAYVHMKSAFNGDKYYHCHGAQGIFGPDGMFYDWFDDCVGRHNDRYFMRDSNVNEILRDLQLGNDIQYWVYLDKGYTRNTHCRCAAQAYGGVPLTDLQEFDNEVMSSVRIGV